MWAYVKKTIDTYLGTVCVCVLQRAQAKLLTRQRRRSRDDDGTGTPLRRRSRDDDGAQASTEQGHCRVLFHVDMVSKNVSAK